MIVGRAHGSGCVGCHCILAFVGNSLLLHPFPFQKVFCSRRLLISSLKLFLPTVRGSYFMPSSDPSRQSSRVVSRRKRMDKNKQLPSVTKVNIRGETPLHVAAIKVRIVLNFACSIFSIQYTIITITHYLICYIECI